MGHMKDLDRRIRQGGDDAIAAACELAGIAKERLRLSANGDCPGRDNAANEDNTPATHATPSEGIEQSGCTLTAEEREAIAYFASFHESPREADATAAATLRGLLERTK